MPARLKALGQLRTPSQWWLLLRVLLVAALVPVLFRCKLATISRWLERRSRCAVSVKEMASIESIVQCVELAMSIGRPLVRAKCLTRSVTLYHFLRPTGLNLAICFGAALRHGQLAPGPGHCWLLKDGRPFLEPNDPTERFVPLYTLPHPFHQMPDPEKAATPC